VLVGAVDVATDQGRDPAEVAATIRSVLPYVPPERLYPCTNCGMVPLDRAVARGKLRALVRGGPRWSRRELGAAYRADEACVPLCYPVRAPMSEQRRYFQRFPWVRVRVPRAHGDESDLVIFSRAQRDYNVLQRRRVHEAVVFGERIAHGLLCLAISPGSFNRAATEYATPRARRASLEVQGAGQDPGTRSGSGEGGGQEDLDQARPGLRGRSSVPLSTSATRWSRGETDLIVRAPVNAEGHVLRDIEVDKIRETRHHRHRDARLVYSRSHARAGGRAADVRLPGTLHVDRARLAGSRAAPGRPGVSWGSTAHREGGPRGDTVHAARGSFEAAQARRRFRRRRAFPHRSDGEVVQQGKIHVPRRQAQGGTPHDFRPEAPEPGSRGRRRRAAARSYSGDRLTDEDLKKPLVVWRTAGFEITPCNWNHRKMAEK